MNLIKSEKIQKTKYDVWFLKIEFWTNVIIQSVITNSATLFKFTLKKRKKKFLKQK